MRESVAPPGWTPSPAVPALTPIAANAPIAGTAPVAGTAPIAGGTAALVASPVAVAAHPADAAVRWRMRAARIDNFLVYGGYLTACLLLHWQAASLAHLLWLAVAGAVYHFAFEAHSGQTPGKRRYGIRVVSADGGGPASPRAIAIRSLVRIVDSLPVCYAVGLVSMVRSGPGRRQRIGDLAGGTVVVAIDGRAAERGTPAWLLPAATVVAVAVSALTVIGMIGGQPQLTSLQTPRTASPAIGTPPAAQSATPSPPSSTPPAT